MLTGKFLLVDKVRSKVRNLGLHLADGVEGGHVLDVEALHILLTTQHIHCYNTTWQQQHHKAALRTCKELISAMALVCHSLCLPNKASGSWINIII